MGGNSLPSRIGFCVEFGGFSFVGGTPTSAVGSDTNLAMFFRRCGNTGRPFLWRQTNFDVVFMEVPTLGVRCRRAERSRLGTHHVLVRVAM